MVGLVAEQLWQFELDKALALKFKFEGPPIDDDGTLASLALIASLEMIATGHYDAQANSTPVHLTSAG